MPYHFYKKALNSKILSQTYRTLITEKKEGLCFASNDYLGFSHHPLLKEAWATAVEHYSLGATGSRLLSGNHQFIQEFEVQIAKDKNQEAALIFNSGFQANITLLSTLLNKQVLKQEPLVFSDRLNHASMHAGCQLAGVYQHRYAHLNLDHLEGLLNQYRHNQAPKFILTESIFGMDGDQADLEGLAALAHKHKAFLYVDEAHATGILGKQGYGLTPDVKGKIQGVMGTFSKALGLAGAYFAADREVIDYIINYAPGFIYSTALPCSLLYTAFQAWQLVGQMTAERQHLKNLSAYLRAELLDLNFTLTPSTSHIFGLRFESVPAMMSAYSYLQQNKIQVGAIRPPTAPSSRLRVALRTDHTLEDIKALLVPLKGLSATLK